ncbi:uncharacterized protein UV8b_01041 [Ustilaginoidea virens]|uniref:BZIP domain-containing protein n=1 Tax=Ustilaginoidea virens TaxID=1159556 RepID=A0A1B5L625_USTVR|nr:uncharacterized protein UV8b_01041 [Ustilaginoidea virens]QUC16800.1 hypothetical protein UV8b_01041 [Ustilaginoidea virens]GAO19034.1 hypothetical protein UVI_02056530 [Ustilaginoidea virens]
MTFASPGRKEQPPAASRPRNRSRKQHVKTPSAPPCPPHEKEVSTEDDWTRVKCPKEKKRIQNRVAQRTYRHRMKARLGELQARLDSHERLRHQQPGRGHGDAEMPRGADGAFTAAAPDVVGMGHPSGISPSLAAAHAHAGGRKGSSPLAAEMAVLPGGTYDKVATHEPEPAFYSHNAQYLHSPPRGYPSPQASHGLLSPPARWEVEQPAEVSQDFLDCLHFQTELLDKLSTLGPEPAFAVQPQYSPVDALPPAVIGLNPSPLNYMEPFTPGRMDPLEYVYDGARTAWKAGYEGKARPSLPALDPLGGGGGGGGGFSSSLAATPPAQPCSADAPAELAGRIEAVVRQVHAAGFESLDAAATAYYTAALGNTPLAAEQHASRSRRLPRAVADVFRATHTWPPWERRGFRDEMAKTARAMLHAESSAARASLAGQLAPLLDKPDLKPQALEALKKTLKREFPTAWAFNAALLSGDGAAGGQTDGSNAVLATVLLQQLAGKVPRSQLVQVVEACL